MQKLPQIKKVKHINSTKSEQPKYRSYEHELSSINHFTIQQKKEEPKLQVAPYDERKQLCNYIKRKICQAREQIKQFKEEIQQNSRQILKREKESEQLENNLDELRLKEHRLNVQLKTEKDQDKATELKIRVQNYKRKIQRTSKKIQQVDQQVEQLQKIQQDLKGERKEIQRFISQNKQCLLKEEFPRRPKIETKRRLLQFSICLRQIQISNNRFS